MTKGLTGIPSLAYVGVNAGSPPNIKMYKRSPTTDDSKNFIIGDLWLNITPTPAASRELWILVALLGNYATWVKILPSTGGGGGNLRSDDLLIEIPDPGTGAINVYGGEPYFGDPAYINMYTNRLDAYTLYVNLKRSINQPNTNATATEGMYKLGSSDFMHNYGTNNTALGHGTLNLTLQPAAQDNTAIGHGALNSVNLAFSCTACGSGALTGLEDGQYVTALGFEAGKNLDGADSDDIMIGSPGVLGDLNCIRIGQGGVGANQQDKFFVPAVWEGVAEPGVATGLTIVNANGKMYVDVIAPDSVLMTDPTGNPIGVKGAIGTVFTGQGAGLADPPPAFLPITSSGGTVTISTDPITNAINLEAAGVAGLIQLTSDTGVVLPAAGNINVFGGDLINTDNTVANTVTVNVVRGLNGEIIGGTGIGSASIYKQLYCSDGSLNVDFVTDPTKIDIKVVGIPPVGGVNALYDHALLSVPPTLNHIQIEQGPNITTVGDVATSKITVSVTDDVDLPLGHMFCRDNVQTSAGSLEALAGHLLLPDTNNTGTQGTIRFNNVRWIHNYGRDTGSGNTFVGERTGNTTLTPASSIHNLGLGFAVLEALTTGQYNTFGGFASANILTSGSYNSGWGRYSLRYLTTGNRNLALGSYSGYNCTGAESDNVFIASRGNLLGVTDNHTIRIGIEGTGDYQQNACYIAGIYNKVPGPTPEMVTIGSDGKLGTTGIPIGGATTFVTDSGTATVSGTTIQIKGGYNIGTRGSSNIVTIDLDDSIQQSATNDVGTSGVYALGGVRGAGSYVGNRFMHAWSPLGITGYNTFLGAGAGRITTSAIGLNNVGIGALVLDAYTAASNNVAVGKNSMTNATTSSNSTCVGSGSGSALTTGGNHVLLGTNAGNVYVTSTNNITIGNGGTVIVGEAAENYTTRIGFREVWTTPPPSHADPDPVPVLTTPGSNAAYVYGIYNKLVGYSGTPVYVDQTGKLGTEGGVAFSFHQDVALSNVTGDGTYYRIGTAAIANGGLVKDFDSTNSVVLGGMGSRAIFTAPFSGKYVFTACATYNIPAAPMPPPIPASTCTYILTSNLSYSFTAYIPDALVGTAQQVSEIVTSFVYLDAGDTVSWAVRISGTTKTIGLRNYQTGPSGELAYDTFFTGYRMA